jgi:hypothetical protein
MYDWTDVWIRTEPSIIGLIGVGLDAAGGKGNPPNMLNLRVQPPLKPPPPGAPPEQQPEPEAPPRSVGLGERGAESAHLRFDQATAEGDNFAVNRGETVTIEIDFDGGFEDGEYIEFTFSARINGREVRVPGNVTDGSDTTPQGVIPPFIELIPSGLPGLLGARSAASPGLAVAVAAAHRKIDAINLRLAEISSIIGRGPEELSVAAAESPRVVRRRENRSSEQPRSSRT